MFTRIAQKVSKSHNDSGMTKEQKVGATMMDNVGATFSGDSKARETILPSGLRSSCSTAAATHGMAR